MTVILGTLALTALCILAAGYIFFLSRQLDIANQRISQLQTKLKSLS